MFCIRFNQFATRNPFCGVRPQIAPCNSWKDDVSICEDGTRAKVEAFNQRQPNISLQKRLHHTVLRSLHTVCGTICDNSSPKNICYCISVFSHFAYSSLSLSFSFLSFLFRNGEYIFSFLSTMCEDTRRCGDTERRKGRIIICNIGDISYATVVARGFAVVFFSAPQ